MINFHSNEYWENTTIYEPFETRSFRYRKEMLPVLYQYFGIKPESNVLDGGCGCGTFTRYLAQGLTTGHITGFDISETFTEVGTKMNRERGFADKITLEKADGYNLHYEDCAFDAVTNYTYLGVLADPRRGLEELIRVCKPGGTVSYMIATTSIHKIGWQGSYPFEGALEMQRLAAKENRLNATKSLEKETCRTDNDKNSYTYPILFKKCGLKDIHLYPYAYGICYSDNRFDQRWMKNLAITETKEDIGALKYRYENRDDFYTGEFTEEEHLRLMELTERKLEYLEENFENDESFEWMGGYNFIVAGTK